MSDDFTPEEVERVDACLRSMRSLTRNIFLVSRIDGTPDAEIAERTGLSVEQVRRHVLKAMLRL